MSSYRAPVVGLYSTTALRPELRKAFDNEAMAPSRLAKALGVTESVVEQLRHGGFAKAKTVARVEASFIKYREANK